MASTSTAVACVDCLHLMQRCITVADVPRLVNPDIRRASAWLVRHLGPEYYVQRREVVCRKEQLPVRHLPLHRVRDLTIEDCRCAKIDKTNRDVVLSNLPHEYCYWINGSMISVETMSDLAQRIIKANRADIITIKNLLRRHGVSVR